MALKPGDRWIYVANLWRKTLCVNLFFDSNVGLFEEHFTKQRFPLWASCPRFDFFVVNENIWLFWSISDGRAKLNNYKGVSTLHYPFSMEGSKLLFCCLYHFLSYGEELAISLLAAVVLISFLVFSLLFSQHSKLRSVKLLFLIEKRFFLNKIQLKGLRRATKFLNYDSSPCKWSESLCRQ